MLNLGSHDVISAGYSNHDIVNFGWMITDWCNYNCSYCCSKGFLVDKFDRKQYRKGLIVPFQLRNIDVDFVIDLAGGEPTVHPYLNRILEDLVGNDKCLRVNINTNLSRSLKYFHNIFDHYKITISASYHAEHHSEQFIEKCIALKDKSFICHINLIDDSKYWPNILKLINICKSNNVRYAFNHLYDTKFRTIKYNKKFYNTFKQINNTDRLYPIHLSNDKTKYMTQLDIFKKKLHLFKGYKCTSLNYIINFDGSIVRECTTDNISKFPKKKELMTPVICPRERGCDCDVMLNYYKEIPECSL